MFDQSVQDKIQIISHSGIRINGEKIIYIDPVQIKDAPHDADLILFTHPHLDHFSPADVKKLLKDSTVIAAPKSMAGLCKLLLHKNITPLLPAQDTELCGIPVKTVAAYNTAKPFHAKPFKWLGYVLTIGETKVYISGDTDITDECMNVECDIALLPVGGGYTIGPVQAAELANKLSPHTVIPIHYGKLLGGEGAADEFKKRLNENIHADIRPSAYSSIMISVYLKAGMLLVAGALLGALAYWI